MASTVFVNTRVRIFSTTTDASGNTFDPMTIQVVVVYPSTAPIPRVVLNYGVDADIVRDDVGQYHLDLFPTVPGPVMVSWSSTSSGQEGLAEDSFIVLPRSVA